MPMDQSGTTVDATTQDIADLSATAIAAGVSAHEAAADPHPGYALESNLGTAATENVGTAAGNVVQLDGSGALPAVDGSNLTGITAGGTPGGSNTQVQYNDGGSFAGSADLTWDDTAKELGVGGDINLDDGGTYTTTLQMVTATANRTISFPDATGTVALVAGSSGQVTYNSAGAQAGDSGLLYDADTGSLTVGGKTITADAPVINLSQTWNNAAVAFTGFKFTVTDSASATGSALLDFIVGTTRRFYVGKGGLIKAPSLPTYADNAAATSGGLVAGDVYKTATGELRITV